MDDGMEEGEGESSSPPKGFGGHAAHDVHDIKDEIFFKLVEMGHEEVASNPDLRDHLDAHFNRLPPRLLWFDLGFCFVFLEFLVF